MLSKKGRIIWLLVAIGNVGLDIYLFSNSPFDAGTSAIIISFSMALILFACTFSFDKNAWPNFKRNFANKKKNTYEKIENDCDDLNDNDDSFNTAYDYERYVAATLMKNGKFSEVKITKKSGDFGADIICKDDYGNRWAIQCKMYSKPVGYKAIQEVLSGMHYYNCQYAMVVTTSTFTNQAIVAARKIGIELVQNFK